MTARPPPGHTRPVAKVAADVDVGDVLPSAGAGPPPGGSPAAAAPHRREVAAAAAVSILSSGLLAIGLAIVLGAALRWDASLYPFWRETAVAAPAYTIVGALITRHLPRSRIGWLFTVLGLVASVQLAAGAYGAVAAGRGWAGAAESAWMSTQAQVAAVFGLVFLLLLFPTGTLPSTPWRPVAWATTSGFSLTSLLIAVGPTEQEDFGGIGNPAHVPLQASLLESLTVTGAALAGAGAAGALLSLVARYRAAGRLQRQQLKWFLWMALSTTALLFLGDLVVPGAGDYAWVLGPASLAVGAAIAVLRYDLYDIDVLIRRSAVYAVLTALLVAGYVALVQVLAAVLPAGAGTSTSLLATAMVAVAFAPMRERTQAMVDRLLYGERRDPYRAISQLAQQLTTAMAPCDSLRVVVETVAAALRSPYVAIEVGAAGDERTAASCGDEREVALGLPLAYQGQVVGHLSVAPRSPGDRFSDEDRHLLTELSRQAGVTAQAVALTTALQESRGRLVMAREEERRRLRRDLHDGLGPALTGVALLADAARGQLQSEPAAADRSLLQIRAETKAAIDSIRRLVYDLRPPALDELGLLGALREQVARMGRGGQPPAPSAGPPDITIDAPTLPALPAAVEVAAYRIIAEALTNVARHARAGHCRVRLELGTELEIEVCDDGCGMTGDCRPGVGVTSMRERAAELGGSLSIGPGTGGGTRVRAVLPIGST